MRINGWYRLGIVASVAWALYGGGSELNKIEKAASAEWARTERACYDHGSPQEGLLPAPASERLTAYCMKRADAVQKEMMQDIWSYVGWRAFLPVVLGWIYALIAVFVVRWVWRGFRPKPVVESGAAASPR